MRYDKTDNNVTSSSLATVVHSGYPILILKELNTGRSYEQT